MESYNYSNRTNTKKVTWVEFSEHVKQLSELLFKENIDIIIGVARAGLIPATTVSCMLRKELYPVRITRRFNDEVISKTPQWKIRVPEELLVGKNIAIIDEIADTGETLSLVSQAINEKNVNKIVTATIFCHTWANPKPDIVIEETDELLLFPWDYQVYENEQWVIHPELKEIIKKEL